MTHTEPFAPAAISVAAPERAAKKGGRGGLGGDVDWVRME
jgi:hypothetical protein